MNITRVYGGHLDLFKEVRRNDVQKMALRTIFEGIEIPDYISINFDFENKVVILLNKKSSQTIFLYGKSIENGQ